MTGDEAYERPYRITDWHGEVVADELDDVPPLLNQEEIDVLASYLEEQSLDDQRLVSVLAKLPDFEWGRDELPEDFRPACKRCGEEIAPDEYAERAFGHYYHVDDGCDDSEPAEVEG